MYMLQVPCLDWGFHRSVLDFLFKIFRIKVRTQGRRETPASTNSRNNLEGKVLMGIPIQSLSDLWTVSNFLETVFPLFYTYFKYMYMLLLWVFSLTVTYFIWNHYEKKKNPLGLNTFSCVNRNWRCVNDDTHYLDTSIRNQLFGHCNNC